MGILSKLEQRSRFTQNNSIFYKLERKNRIPEMGNKAAGLQSFLQLDRKIPRHTSYLPKPGVATYWEMTSCIQRLDPRSKQISILQKFMLFVLQPTLKIVSKIHWPGCSRRYSTSKAFATFNKLSAQYGILSSTNGSRIPE